MQILLIIAIVVIISIVSAASKKKTQQQQQDDEQATNTPTPVPHRNLSDIQRALSFFDEFNDDEPPAAKQTVSADLPSSSHGTPLHDGAHLQSTMPSSEGESSWSREPMPQWIPSKKTGDTAPPIRATSRENMKARYVVPQKDLAQYSKNERTSINKANEDPDILPESSESIRRINLRLGPNELIQAVVYSEILMRRRRL